MLSQINQSLKELLLPFLHNPSHLHFPLLIEQCLFDAEQQARNKIKDYLEKMDFDFRYSPDRTNNYYVKDTKERTIITMAGEVKYTRTIYIDKITKKRYCYVDEKMGIDRYIRYTNDVASYVYEAYSEENSMIKVGQEIGRLIHCKYFINSGNVDYSINRMTIYNLINRIKQTRFAFSSKRAVEDLYIIADEKYIPSSLKNDSKMMVKSLVFVEGLNSNNQNRHFYINPFYFSHYKGDSSNELLNIIIERYDLSILKRIHFLSDGGIWLKALKNNIKFENIETIEYLDKYHFCKALYDLAKDKTIYKLALNYLQFNKRKELKQLLEALDTNNLNKNKRDYIFNNYSSIINTLNLNNMNCSAEQVISHHLASQFTSVAKAYSKNNIDRYLSMRDNVRNKENMKLTYLLSLDSKDDDEIITLNKKQFNYSLFDKDDKTHDYVINTITGDKLKLNHF